MPKTYYEKLNRWFREATENKAFRKCYEKISGRKPNWKSFDERKHE